MAFCPRCKRLMRPDLFLRKNLCPSCGLGIPMEGPRPRAVATAAREERAAPATPTFSYRAGQAEAVRQILTAINEGVTTILLEAPVGFGKSLVVTEVAKQLRARGWRGYYTSPQNALLDQVASDPLTGPSWSVARGRKNYPCLQSPNDTTVAEGWCFFGRPCSCLEKVGPSGGPSPTCPGCHGTGRRDPRTDPWSCGYRDGQGEPERCPYFEAREIAARSQLSAMTFDYLISASTTAEEGATEGPPEVGAPAMPPLPRFEPRDFLIIDEAHGLGEEGPRSYALTLHREKWPSAEWSAWWAAEGEPLLQASEEELLALSPTVVEGFLLAAKEAARLHLEHLVVTPLSGEEDLRKRSRARMQAEQEERKLSNALEDLRGGSPWIVGLDADTRGLRLSPVLGTTFLTQLLWPLARVRILASATFLDPETFLSELGLPTGKVLHLRPDSDFPPGAAPIYTRPSVTLSYDRREQGWREATEMLDVILDHEPERGIVHVNSYTLLDHLRLNAAERHRARLVFHGRRSRTGEFERWTKEGGRGTVFVGVHFEQGTDLKDELARWQVVVKCPWAPVKDPRVVARRALPDGGSWYELQALRSLVQSFGRIVRSPEDHGRTYVLDASAVRLLHRCSSTLPPYIRARLQAGEAGPPFLFAQAAPDPTKGTAPTGT